MLAEIADLDDDALDACLREGIDANVLRVTGDTSTSGTGCSAKPSTTTCCRASAPAPTPDGRHHAGRAGRAAGMAELGLLAFHWYAAHDQPEAFRASVRAGLAARTYGGPEAVTHLERALELYDQVPHETQTSRQGRPAPTAREGLQGTRGARPLPQLMREALDLLDEDSDRLLASRVYSSYACCATSSTATSATTRPSSGP